MRKFEFTLGDYGAITVKAFPHPRDLKSFGKDAIEIESIEGGSGNDLSGTVWDDMAVDYIHDAIIEEFERRARRIFCPC